MLALISRLFAFAVLQAVLLQAQASLARSDALPVSSLSNHGPVSLNPYLSRAAVDPLYPERTPAAHTFSVGPVQRSIGPSQAEYWYRFSFYNDLDGAQDVYLNLPHIRQGKIYVHSGERSWYFGTGIENAQWPKAVGSYVIPFRIDAGQSLSVEFYVHSISTVPFQPMLGLGTDVMGDLSSEKHKNFVAAGFLLALLLYAGVAIIISGPVAEYRYYFYYATALFLFMIYTNGWLLEPLLAYPKVYEALYSLIVPIGTIFQIMFIRNFFTTWKRAPRWDLVLRCVSGIYALIIVLGLVLGVAVVVRLLALLTFPLIFGLFSMSLNFYLRKFESSEFFAVAFISYSIMLGISITAYYGVIPLNTYTREAYQFGICLQLLFFMLAIANQVRVYREREIRLRSDAEEARAESIAKTSFLTHMSHELRTPLNGVIGMAQLLEETKQTEQQRFYSGIIIKSGNLLLSLINDVLDYSKISADKLILESSPFDFNQALADCIEVFIPTMMDKGIPVYLNITPDCPSCLIGDEHRVKQILINLVANSLKFTEEGRVDVRINLGRNAEGDALIMMEVKDTGIGIDDETLQKIFGEFIQEDVSTTRRFGGSGLGLSIIKAIVEQMGGSITANSTKNVGSSFNVSIPILIDEAAEKNRKANLQRLAGRTIYVDSANDYHSNLIFTHVSHWGGTAVLFSSLKQLKASLNTQNATPSPDCIVAYTQPDTNFSDAVERYHDIDIPVLILHTTAPNNRFESLPSHIDSLQLPVELQTLLTTIIQRTEGLSITSDHHDKLRGLDCSDWRVLLVEDNEVNRAVAIGILKRWNITPDIAFNGVEALELHRKNPYPLVFMDCEMPLMDGYQAAQAIRELEKPGLMRCKIVALTAHALQQEKDKCLAAGMDVVITKPLTLKQIELFMQSYSYEEVVLTGEQVKR